MSHHRCCCEGTVVDPPNGDTVPCVEVTFSVPQESCFFDYEPQVPPLPFCQSVEDWQHWIAGGTSGHNMTFRVPMIGSVPSTHPYGSYSYHIDDAPISASYQFVRHLVTGHQYDGPSGVEYDCLTQDSVESFTFTRAEINVDVNFNEDGTNRVIRCTLSLHGRKRFTVERKCSNSDCDLSTESLTNLFIGGVFQGDHIGSTNVVALGESIANGEVNTGCPSGFGGPIAGGSAVVRQTSDLSCFEYPPVFRAVACGTPPNGVPSEIFVDVSTIPATDPPKMNPRHSNWTFKLTNEQLPNTLPTSNVSWSEFPCYPSATSCDGTLGPYAVDTSIMPLAAQTGYIGGVQVVLDGGGEVPGPAHDVDWSDDLCPAGSPAPLIASPLKKTGMMTEAQLDAMGADPEREKRRLRQGGCCSPPSPID